MKLPLISSSILALVVLPEPAVAVEQFSWDGFYAGITGGTGKLTNKGNYSKESCIPGQTTVIPDVINTTTTVTPDVTNTTTTISPDVTNVTTSVTPDVTNTTVTIIPDVTNTTISETFTLTFTTTEVIPGSTTTITNVIGGTTTTITNVIDGTTSIITNVIDGTTSILTNVIDGTVISIPGTIIRDVVDFNPNDESWFLGGEIGYDKQVGPLLFGGVLDISGTNYTTRYNSVMNNFSLSTELNWFSTLRARVGLPLNQFLVYGTAGFAVGNFDVEYTSWSSWSGSYTEPGWSAGAGAAYALNRNWVIDLSYLHLDFNSVSQTIGDAKVKTDLYADLVKLGINYKF